MDVLYSLALATAAFWLGACPFSFWLGKRFLGKDITHYGDGNPGAANVFNAGSPKLGFIAVLLDITKGMPFVFIAYTFAKLPHALVMAIGLCAILGHAYSPFLRFKGGKAIAVTFGVLIALPQKDILFVYTLLTVLGVFFIEQHAWVSMCGPIGTTIYLFFSRGAGWELYFMLFILVLFTIKQKNCIQSLPSFNINLIDWLQSRKRET